MQWLNTTQTVCSYPDCRWIPHFAWPVRPSSGWCSSNSQWCHWMSLPGSPWWLSYIWSTSNKQKIKCLSVTPELLRSAMSEFLEQYWRNKTLFLHLVIWWLWWLLTVMSNKSVQKISHRADKPLTTDHLSVTLNTRTHPGLCSESSAVHTAHPCLCS